MSKGLSNPDLLTEIARLRIRAEDSLVYRENQLKNNAPNSYYSLLTEEQREFYLFAFAVLTEWWFIWRRGELIDISPSEKESDFERYTNLSKKYNLLGEKLIKTPGIPWEL